MVITSAQGGHLERWLSCVEPVPVVQQFLLVKSCPFKDHGQSTGWQLTLQYGHWVQADAGLLTDIICVQMSGEVIIEEHPDYDAEEAADLGHDSKIVYQL